MVRSHSTPGQGRVVRGRRGPNRRPLLSRYPLTIDLAVALARAAADDQPALVTLVFDDSGLLIAVRPDDVPLAEAVESCRTLLGLLAPEGRGPSIVVSVEPSFGVEAEPAAAVWAELAGAFEENQATLLDWLLVLHPQVASVASFATPSSPW